jgi:hypothetical protein
MCYELHYRGFAGVDAAWEWNPTLLHLRAQLERAFLSGVRRDVGPVGHGHTAMSETDALSADPIDGGGLSDYLREIATWDQVREYFAHRSIYHLKEGDPHAWAIPRLTGQAKARCITESARPWPFANVDVDTGIGGIPPGTSHRVRTDVECSDAGCAPLGRDDTAAGAQIKHSPSSNPNRPGHRVGEQTGIVLRLVHRAGCRGNTQCRVGRGRGQPWPFDGSPRCSRHDFDWCPINTGLNPLACGTLSGRGSRGVGELFDDRRAKSRQVGR